MRYPSVAAAFVLAAIPAAGQSWTLIVPPSTVFAARIVMLHNRARAAAGVPPLVWDYTLAASADSYARRLAASGRWDHSPSSERPGQGENLWMGTRGAFAVDQMVGSWAAEGRWFGRGVFPHVSRTGNWHDVGHYTQMIWPGSTRIGCALRASARNDYLVCRYAPTGNVVGTRLR
jgi:hypothetical protein